MVAASPADHHDIPSAVASLDTPPPLPTADTADTKAQHKARDYSATSWSWKEVMGVGVAVVGGVLTTGGFAINHLKADLVAAENRLMVSTKADSAALRVDWQRR